MVPNSLLLHAVRLSRVSDPRTRRAPNTSIDRWRQLCGLQPRIGFEAVEIHRFGSCKSKRCGLQALQCNTIMISALSSERRRASWFPSSTATPSYPPDYHTLVLQGKAALLRLGASNYRRLIAAAPPFHLHRTTLGVDDRQPRRSRLDP